MYLREWHHRGAYPNYMHKWRYRMDISKYTSMSGITEGKEKVTQTPYRPE
jgi:hypothetical protein